MDFGTLLHVAQKNDQKPKNEVKYYNTKFEPPKKEERSKRLSENIKKFLARKEAEEKEKALEAKVRKEELLALRSQDRKAQRRVQVMLKRTKSANKAVMSDAIDKDNTNVTLAGPSQPDEDDYGYVSQEASAFYNKMMQKYNNMPEEDKFAKSKKNTNTNLKEIKERVRQAILREQEEALLPHKRKRKHKEDMSDEKYDDDRYTEPELEKREKQKARPAPPPMNFTDLLKIAEKKQFEPIKIAPKIVEEEKLMTKKQKKEFEREQAAKERREMRDSQPPSQKNCIAPPNNKIPKLSSSVANNGKPKSISESNASIRIPKLNSDDKRPSNNNISNNSKPTLSKRPDDKIFKRPDDVRNSNNLAKRPYDDTKIMNKKMLQPSSQNRLELSNTNKLNSKSKSDIEKSRSLPSGKSNTPVSRPSSSSVLNSNNRNLNNRSLPPQNRPTDITGSVKNKPSALVNNRKEQNISVNKDVRVKSINQNGERVKQLTAANMKPRQFPPADVKPKQFPPADLKPKQFPPSDVRSRFPVKRKPLSVNKRRILDDDSEYDSEMDDFIDDGPEGEEDYSKYISEIFGYDKSKYRNEENDDDNMESSFSQVMKEEYVSSKIGLLEDLEDMKLEAEEKRKKALMKKKVGHK